MRITELFTAKSIELDSAASNRDEILSRLVEAAGHPRQHHRHRSLQEGSLRPGG